MKNSLKNTYLSVLFAGLTPALFYAAMLNKSEELIAISIISAIFTLIFFFSE